MDLINIKATIVTAEQVAIFYTTDFESQFKLSEDAIFNGFSKDLTNIELNEENNNFGNALWKYNQLSLLSKLGRTEIREGIRTGFKLNDLEFVCTQLKTSQRKNNRSYIELNPFDVTLNLEHIDLVTRTNSEIIKKYLTQNITFDMTLKNPNIFLRYNLIQK